jgi:AraC-like DNA-binding protein
MSWLDAGSAVKYPVHCLGEMGALVKDMDNFSINTQAYPRHFPCRMPILAFGYHREKTSFIARRFVSFNYSFILKGGGSYRIDDRDHEVNAPCVITQWPGVHVEYGPSRTWEEFYLIYHQKLLREMTRRGFARRDRPVWHIADAGPVLRRLHEIRELYKQLDVYGKADLLDAACENMVLASLAGESRAPLDENERAVLAVRSQLEARYLQNDVDIDALALNHGLSGSTFRRYWARMVGPPPARFVIELRLRHAARLLVETPLPVRAIAAQCGFTDALYFSRRFHKFLGMPPTEYRAQHKAAVFGQL